MSRSMRAPAEAVWRERLERFAVEQGSVAEFCRREGVSLPSFYRWRKMLGSVSARRGADASASLGSCPWRFLCRC